MRRTPPPPPPPAPTTPELPVPTTAPVAIAAAARDAVKVYGRDLTTVTALDHVSVEFPVGAFTAIMGPSGSGKSTLLHCLAGLDRLTAGEVEVGGQALSSLNERQLTELRRDRIGFVFQSFNLVPTLTAEENIALPLSLAGKTPDKDWFDHVVSTLGLGDRLKHRPTELSGGQQQRVAVGRALVSRPAVIFADEPTGALDSRTGAELLAFLANAASDLGQSIVMVTHDATAAGYAGRVLFLADGRLVDEMLAPTPSAVLDRIKSLGPH